MESNELQNNDQPLENIPDGNEIIPAETSENPEELPSDIGEEGSNLDICPNCLEPNTDNLAVCKYCGMPLHQGADTEAFEMKESEEELAKNRAEAVPQEKKPAKKQESGFRRVMPWLGLYLIYYAITGCFDIKRQIQMAAEEGQPVNAPLAYGAQVIWFAAGLMMAWPLIKKGYRKLRGLPPEEEVEEEQAADSAETAEQTEADESGEVMAADEGTPENEADESGEIIAADEGTPENEADESGEIIAADEGTPEAESETDMPEAEDFEELPEAPADPDEQPDDVIEAKLSDENGSEEDEKANWL